MRSALTWQSPWDKQRWEFERSRLWVAHEMSGFSATRTILTADPDLPKVIEAVAAFPSAKECREELEPAQPDPTAAEALLMLAAPLLIPRGEEGKDFGPLRAAAELARENHFRKERQAYYDWMRAFVKPLQSPERESDEVDLDKVRLDKGSLKLAQERLHDLVAAERRLLAKWERRRWWTRTEYALTVIGVGVTAGVALTAALPVLGAAAPLIGFGGWMAGKRAAPEQLAERPLGGASMFVSVQRHLGWQE